MTLSPIVDLYMLLEIDITHSLKASFMYGIAIQSHSIKEDEGLNPPPLSSAKYVQLCQFNSMNHFLRWK